MNNIDNEFPRRRVPKREIAAEEAALAKYTKEDIDRHWEEALAKMRADPGLEAALAESNRVIAEWEEEVRRERAGETFPLRHTGVGLCTSCVHARRIRSSKGSLFVLCGRSATDPRFPKYPRLPVSRCIGYEERPDLTR